MSTTETTAQVSSETCRPWCSAGRFAWVICVDEIVILDGDIDEPDDRTDAELVEALIEAGVESVNDQAAFIRCHRENVWGVYCDQFDWTADSGRP